MFTTEFFLKYIYFILIILTAFVTFFVPIPERFNRKKIFSLLIYILLMQTIYDFVRGMNVVVSNGFPIIFPLLFIMYFSYGDEKSHYGFINGCIGMVSYFFMVIIQHVAILIFGPFLHIDYGHLYEPAGIAFSIGFLCLAYILCRIFRWILMEKVHIYNVTLNSDFKLAIIFLLMCIVGFYFFNFFYIKDSNYPKEMVLTNALIFLLIFVCVAFLLSMIAKNIQAEERAKNDLKHFEDLKRYNEELEKLYTDMRSFKHDYMNMLSSMYGFIDQGDMADLKVYFKKEIWPISQDFAKRDASLGYLSRIHIQSVKSLLLAKLFYASNQGIHTTIRINGEVNDLNIREMDIVRVLGIFMDNAIEGALETKSRLLSLKIEVQKNNVTFLIANSCNEDNISMNDLAALHYSTKGEARGMGLYNVRQILSKYQNLIHETTCQNQYFMQKLEIFSEV